MNSPLPVASAADEPTTTTDEASSARPSEQKSAGWTMAETASLMSNVSDGRTGYREPDIDGYRDAEARGMPDVRSPKTTRVTSSRPTTTIHTLTVSPAHRQRGERCALSHWIQFGPRHSYRLSSAYRPASSSARAADDATPMTRNSAPEPKTS